VAAVAEDAEGDAGEISELRRKLEEISSRLQRIEQVLSRLEPYMGEFQKSTRVIREGMEFYGAMVQLMSRFTGIQRFKARFPDLARDEINRLIVKALMRGEPMNISQLTAAIRMERGTASRRIVRGRVALLAERGVIRVARRTRKATYYELTSDLL